ncbi:MAG: hypothetical protein ACRBBN_10570 [Methyloligellaceae bacterium]
MKNKPTPILETVALVTFASCIYFGLKGYIAYSQGRLDASWIIERIILFLLVITFIAGLIYYKNKKIREKK